jgi:hypothetical protein
MRIFIYQIYYNNETQKKILSGFIPLNNTKNLRPDWFEFWVILNFLRNNILDDDAWYGFLSPKFYEKTGFNSNFVFNVIICPVDQVHSDDGITFAKNPIARALAYPPLA